MKHTVLSAITAPLRAFHLSPVFTLYWLYYLVENLFKRKRLQISTRRTAARVPAGSDDPGGARGEEMTLPRSGTNRWSILTAGCLWRLAQSN